MPFLKTMRTVGVVSVALLAAVVVVAAGPVLADEYATNADRCSSDTIDPDLRIGACSWLLSFGQHELYFPLVFYNRGIAYGQKGQYDRAIQDYTDSIRLKPKFAEAFYNRGAAYIRNGQYDQAIRDFDQVIRLKPDDATAFGNRGIAYEIIGRRDQALRDYKKQYELGSRKKWLLDKLKKYGALP